MNLYRVVDGRRRQIAGADIAVPSGIWLTLAVRAVGERITAGFNGKTVIDVRDGTFPQPGRVALWTKADSVSYFDRLTIRETR